MSELKDLHAQMQREWSEMKEKVNNVEASTGEKYDALDNRFAEIEEAFEKYDEDYNRLEAKMKRLQRAGSPSPEGFEEEMQAHNEAFKSFLLTDSTERKEFNPRRAGLDTVVVAEPKVKQVKGESDQHIKNTVDIEFKALSVDSDADGGLLIMPTVASTFITRLFDTSPMRQYAEVTTIDGDRWIEPVDDDEAASGWVGERQTRSETDTPQLDELEIFLGEVYAKPKSTQKMLDMMSDVEGWLTGKITDKIARTENTAFVTGNGAKKPKGVLEYVGSTSSDVWTEIPTVISGAASALTAAGIINLKADLQVGYLSNARYFMNRTTRADIRKLREDAVSGGDAAGAFLWQPGLQGGDPDLLLGYPIAIFEDMPDVASSANPILFGDMREAYKVIDHTRGLRILRDPYSAKPYVEFYTTKYVGGGLKQGRALRAQTVSS